MTNKRITLTIGDWIKLSDIPNEQVFNLVKKCFTNAGFNTESEWDGSFHWKVFHAYYKDRACFAGNDHYSSTRQLSLSDVFNSVNGGMDWQGCEYLHITPNHLIYNQTYSIDLGFRHYIVKRIHDTPEVPEAIISPKTTQWWDYKKGVAVGLPERSSLVSYCGLTCDVLYTVDNGAHLLCLLLIEKPEFPFKMDTQWVNVHNLTPLDYKTPKQIAVDMALKHSSPTEAFKEYTERLYDAGLLKAI